MIRVGVIGYGYWGPNLVRNFADCPQTKVAAVCDRRPERRGGARMDEEHARLDGGQLHAAHELMVHPGDRDAKAARERRQALVLRCHVEHAEVERRVAPRAPE